MISDFFLFLKERAKIKDTNRYLYPSYFQNTDHQEFFQKNGYIVIENCIDTECLNKLKEGYNTIIDTIPDEQKKVFFSTANLKDSSVRNFGNKLIKEETSNSLKKIFDTSICKVDCGGTFLIKPPGKGSFLGVHQDSPIIDERKYYAIYVWIPLCDMHKKNGTLKVLPGSHLWGNYHRSRFLPWTFRKQTKFISKLMKPIYVKEGDIICFDSAMIHASNTNETSTTRVAISAAVLPKEYNIIHYFRDKTTPSGKVEKYIVDENFFLSEDVSERPSNKYQFSGYEDWIGNKWVSKSYIKKLINLYNCD